MEQFGKRTSFESVFGDAFLVPVGGGAYISVLSWKIIWETLLTGSA